MGNILTSRRQPQHGVYQNDDFKTGGVYALEDEHGNLIPRPNGSRTKPMVPVTMSESIMRLKLEGQKITPFSGNMEEWTRWKTQTMCAFSGTGYENILEDHLYAITHWDQNRVVFSQLLLATVEGTAYHLVHKHKEDANGHTAWQFLKKWYDGDAMKYETVEQLRY